MTTATLAPEHTTAQETHPLRTVMHTTCCIVGAGPAGTLLALLLARRGIPVILLEAHADFDRDFRGDTVHPAIMEILDEIGLADQVLALPHTKIRKAMPPGASVEVDFSRLPTRFPFITMMPQARFLECLTTEAARYPAFRLIMGANVRELVEEDGIVRGVRYQGHDGWYEVRALLTVGADGRFSRLRQLASLPVPITTAQPIDVLWFRLSRQSTDPQGLQARFGNGAGLIMLDRGALWQLGYLLPKGGYQQLHEAGLPAFQQTLKAIVPWLVERVPELEDWKHFSLLSVASDFMPRWYRAGLLLIGDAAHVMSPVGGNGINYAVQDAVAAFNLLAEPLHAGRLTVHDLAAVQQRRGWPTRITQAIVNQIQDRVLAPALASRGPFSFPAIGQLMLRTPLLRDLPLRWLAFGLWPVHIRPSLRTTVAVEEGVQSPSVSKELIMSHPRIRAFNKHIFNRFIGTFAGTSRTPFAIIRHVGRRSRKLYETPIIVEPVEDTFVIALTYGPAVDWYRNVVAAGGATLLWHGNTYALQQPEPVERTTALSAFPPLLRPILRRLGTQDFVRLKAHRLPSSPS